MSFVETAPAPLLRMFVECFWTCHGPLKRGFRVLPDGCVDLLLDRQMAMAKLVGTMSRARVLPACSSQNLVAVRFRPGGAQALLQLPVGELADQVVPLELLHEITDACLQVAQQVLCSQDGIAELQEFLVGRLSSVSESDYRALVLAQYCSSPWHVSIGALAKELGISRQFLTREIRRTTGLGAKALVRTARLQRVVSQFSEGQLGGAQLALQAGYADQAHFINDFQDLVGVTPGQYAQEMSAE